MNLPVMKRLIDEGIVDFPKWLMRGYKDILLTEMETVVILELFRQKQQGNTFLNPSKIVSEMTLAKDDLLTILDGLIKKGYVTIQFKKQANGKETEEFHLDEIYRKLITSTEIAIREQLLNEDPTYRSAIEEVSALIENQFQKQLKPLEIEMIDKWLNTDMYALLDIKKALLDAMKANRFSMSYVDNILLKRKVQSEKKKATTTSKGKKSVALQSILDEWDKSE
ncbi:MAG: DnaD domain protein [Candidatus Izemoplasmatales bacterium]